MKLEAAGPENQKKSQYGRGCVDTKTKATYLKTKNRKLTLPGCTSFFLYQLLQK